MKKNRKILLFGATGAIGQAVGAHFEQENSDVIRIVRTVAKDENLTCWDPLNDDDTLGATEVCARGPYDVVVWAQGANCNDSAYTVSASSHNEMYRANVLYIVQSLQFILSNKLLNQSAKLCVVSSIWQNIARQNKYSYCITKAALQGLVLSAANDLGKDGYLINAVLPGVIDTPMTRRNLSEEQIEKIVGATQFGRLPAMQDVVNAVYSVCSESNTGLTGQFLQVDLGFSNVRVI